jgi:translation initiation factor IF-3
VRLVDADGTQLGITPLPEALQLAYGKEMDLVEVAPDANPPVCKIMDFNKYKYDMAQRAKEAKRKSTTTTVKEMKYRVKIGKGDLETKTRQVAKFLGEGHKVKITIMFRGRENDHPELGLKILDWVVEHVDHVAKVEAAPKRDGRNMVMVLAPDKQKQQQHAKALAAAAEADAAPEEKAIDASAVVEAIEAAAIPDVHDDDPHDDDTHEDTDDTDDTEESA